MGKTQRRAQTKVAGSNKNLKNDQFNDSKTSRKGGKAGRKGRSGWASELETELSLHGLRVHEVAADGSCFFRSLADQLEGRSGDHRQLRKSVVNHIQTNRELYEPFIEDDEPFDDYIDRMAEEGTWAGNLELQAASIELKVNLKIYQASQPPWLIKNFPENDVPMLHLSYHDGMHYNSVRLLDDYGTGPPEPIPINYGDDKGRCSREKFSESALRRVKEGTGCDDDALIVAALGKVGGNVDAAIEALVEELHGEEIQGGQGGGSNVENQKEQGQAADSSGNSNLAQERPVTTGGGDGRDLDNGGEFVERVVKVELEVSRGGKGKRVKLRLQVVADEEENGNKSSKTSISSSVVSKNDKEANDGKDTRKKSSKTKGKGSQALPARNARCPCGSTIKYKNCCGASKAARAQTQTKSLDDNQAINDAGVAMQTLYI